MMKIIVKDWIIMFLCFCFAFGLTACGGQTSDLTSSTKSSVIVSSDETSDASSSDTSSDSVSEPQTSSVVTEVSSVSSQTATSLTGGITSKITSSKATESVSSKSPTTASRNLLKGFLGNLDIKDKTKMYDWDKENKYITASHSLECSWGNGYGKAYLIDGVKASSALLFDMGAWVSCTVNPGWGANTGTIDEKTITWKKADLDEWLIFDLQKTYSVEKVTFSTLYKSADRGMPQDFTIEVSTDKNKWNVVHQEKGYLMDITSIDQTFSFKAVKARYVKLHFTKGSNLPIDPNLAYSAALSEVEIWGKE